MNKNDRWTAPMIQFKANAKEVFAMTMFLRDFEGVYPNPVESKSGYVDTHFRDARNETTIEYSMCFNPIDATENYIGIRW